MSTVFRVILEGSQEVHPRINTTASGVGTVVFDSEAVAASYSFDIQGRRFRPYPASRGAQLRRRRPTTMSPARIFTLRTRA